MIPTGAKLWFGIAGFALVATVAYFVASDGEEYGSMVLLSLVLAGFTLGLLSSLTGDGDVAARRGSAVDTAGSGQTGEGGALATAPGRVELAAAWPAFGAVGLAVAAVGLATGSLLLYVGLLVVVAAGIEWMVQAWAERATGDAARNRELRNRLMSPIEVPVVAAALIALVIIAFSRVLLAVPRAGSTVVAIVVAVAILGAAFLVTSRPRLGSSLVTGVVVVGVVGLLAGGIVGGVAGERDFEVHEEEEGEGSAEVEAVQAVVTATNTDDYDEEVVNVPVGVPVILQLENQQGGVQHNVHLTEPEDIVGELVLGPGTAAFEVTFAEAGEYAFVCDVYPTMEGTIEAVDQPADGEDTTEDAPDEGSEGGGAGVDELDGAGS